MKALMTSNRTKIGDKVTAIGNPLGLKNVVSNGNISGYYQDNIKVYQHTAPISHGSSGGALLNNMGRLIGITYASIEGGQNLNLAIPIKYFEKEYNKVKNNTPILVSEYNLLNNIIINNKNGTKLMKYVSNDKLGSVDSCNNLYNSEYFDNNNINSDDINIDSFLYLISGSKPGYLVVGYNNETESIERYFHKGHGYEIALIKKNKLSDEKYIVDSLKSIFEQNDDRNIFVNDNYIYYVECYNYDKCDNVKKLLEKFK